MSAGKSRLCLKLGQRKLFQPHPKPPQQQQPLPEAAPTSQGNGQPPDTSSASCTATQPLPFAGLLNLGNTCYANSVLQVLRFCPGFVNKLSTVHGTLIRAGKDGCDSSPSVGKGGSPCCNVVQGDPPAMEPTGEGLAARLYSLWAKMHTEEQKGCTVVEPIEFISQLKKEQPLFDNQLQHDAQEVLRYLLTILQDTCNSVQLPLTSTNGQAMPTGCNVSPCSHLPMVITVEDEHDSTPAAGKKRKLVHADQKSAKKQRLARKRQSRVTAFFATKKQVNGSQPATPIDPVVQCTHEKKPKFADFIAEMFQGSLAYQLRCFECDGCTRRTEPFLDLSVPVGNQDLPGFPSGVSPLKADSSNQLANGAKMVGPYSLSWALDQFAFKEKLRGENKYWCASCCHFCEAERSILISELPPVMTVHLNRFTTQLWGVHSGNIMVSKMGGNLAVPLVINFSQWCSNECKNRNKMYSLFAVVFHSGSSCTSGHYTACVRARECLPVAAAGVKGLAGVKGHHWLYFDDEQVERLSEDQVVDMLSPLSNGSCAAYILFYT